jgi:hypothetical protein
MSIIAKLPAINFSGQHSIWKLLLPVIALKWQGEFLVSDWSTTIQSEAKPPHFGTSAEVLRIAPSRQTHHPTLSTTLR